MSYQSYVFTSGKPITSMLDRDIIPSSGKNPFSDRTAQPGEVRARHCNRIRRGLVAINPIQFMQSWQERSCMLCHVPWLIRNCGACWWWQRGRYEIFLTANGTHGYDNEMRAKREG